MTADPAVRRAWLSGFVTGVAACGLALYAKRSVERRRPRILRDDGTVIPIE